ncbi:Uncharacterised protein [Mycobacteroides abscessus subsp. massiliense]|nr:Uncharacterised protein [Mycobacteroides abscessus subsp. massiliense]SKS51899.1 Uncharacterised protein [Mycobacteroides abscessus subsp. abscessus]
MILLTSVGYLRCRPQSLNSVTAKNGTQLAAKPLRVGSTNAGVHVVQRKRLIEHRTRQPRVIGKQILRPGDELMNGPVMLCHDLVKTRCLSA